MGTSNESKRNKDEEESELIIPWAFVPYSVRIELIKKLNPDVTMSGNDWRMLASKLGYTTGDINYIESEKDNNTAVLFKQYDTKAGASVNDVYRSLQNMERQDCLEILRKALPEIQQAYNKANESQTVHSAAPTAQLMAPMGQFQWPGSYPYPHHPTSAYGSHACCSYTHSFPNCCATCHGHHLGACPSNYVVQMPHSHHAGCPTLSHLETAQKTFEPSFSPPHHPMPSAYGCLVQPQPSTLVSVTQPLGSGSPSCIIRHGTLESGSHPGYSPGHSNYKGFPPLYSPNQNVSSMPLPNNISVLDNSNLTSNNSSSSSSSNSSNGVARQHSNECNVTQALNSDRRLRYNNSRETLDSRDSIDQYCAALLQDDDHTGQIGFRSRNGQCSRFPDSSDDVNGKYYFQDSEAKVQNGSNEFTDEIYMDRHNRHGTTSVNSSVLQNNTQPPAGRNHPSSHPNIVRANPENSIEEFQNLILTEKPALPIRGKNVDNRAALREIKVFVTYSWDSENHGKQVLSLCRFLQSNRFGCSVDVSEKKSLDRSLEKLAWCKEKMLEADFILVCISQKYLEDISSTNSSFLSQTHERQLHTREIYELMNYEYLKNQHRYGLESNKPAQRFVPLIFPQMTNKHVPSCMRNCQAFDWPKQYTKLVKMLREPQSRFMGRRSTQKAQLGEIEREGGDLDAASGMDMSNLMNGVLCSS